MTLIYLSLVCLLVYLWVGPELKNRQFVFDRTRETYQTASYIYEKNKPLLPTEKIKELIHDTLFAAAWDNGKGYYFVEDMTGRPIPLVPDQVIAKKAKEC